MCISWYWSYIRYIIIKFSHYGLGLSNSFSKTGNRDWILKVTFFVFLFSYISFPVLSVLIKSYRGDFFESTVNGRICLLIRYCKLIFIWHDIWHGILIHSMNMIFSFKAWALSRQCQQKIFPTQTPIYHHYLYMDCICNLLQKKY